MKKLKIANNTWVSRASVVCAIALALMMALWAHDALAQRKLTFGVNWNPGDDASAGFVPVVEAFQALHPDVEVEIVWVTALTQAGFASTERTITMWAAGVAPDVVMVATDVLGQHAFAGLLTPLDGFVAESGINPERFVPGSWNEMHWDGSMYAMPMKVDPNFALVWNKDYAAEVGLPAEDGPSTLSAYEEWFRRLTRVGPNGALERLGAKPWDVYGNTNTVYTWGWLFGGEFYDPINHQVTADHPNNVRALEWVRSYYREYGPSADQFAFPNDREGMRFAVTENLTAWLRIHTDIPLGVGMMPVNEDGGPANPAWVGGWALGIMSGADDPELAWEFVKFLTADVEGTAILSQPARWIPAYLDSEAIPEYLDDPYIRVYLQTATTAQFHRPVMPLSSDYGAALDRAFTEVMTGVRQPADALAFVTSTIQAELDEALGR